jgi:hypothetical protein
MIALGFARSRIRPHTACAGEKQRGEHESLRRAHEALRHDAAAVFRASVDAFDVVEVVVDDVRAEMGQHGAEQHDEERADTELAAAELTVAARCQDSAEKDGHHTGRK